MTEKQLTSSFYFPRFALGVYLTFHFTYLMFYSHLIFGTEMPFDAKLSPTYGMIPNILNIELFIVAPIFMFIMALLSICLALEFKPKICAAILWYGWMCLINRNPLINNPGIAYIGWILLAMQFVNNGMINNRVFWISWFLMAAGYTSSGLHKFMLSPSWLDGTAIEHVLSSGLARNNILVDTLLRFPFILQLMTWFTLFLEISFLFIGTFYKTRFWYWIIYLVMHIGILATINFTDLTWGVLCIHIFTIDKRWYHQYQFIKKLVDWVATLDDLVITTAVLCGVTYGMIMIVLVGRYNVMFCTALVGLAVTSYGIYITKYPDRNFFCSEFKCSSVLKSKYAHLTAMVFGLKRNTMFDIPNTYFGIIFYLSIICYQFCPLSLVVYAKWILFAASISSIMVCLYLAYILFFVMHEYCQVCVASYGVNFVILVTSVLEILMA
jgi:vitamin-K-epoxide reductase (warfarin-sensitive)